MLIHIFGRWNEKKMNKLIYSTLITFFILSCKDNTQISPLNSCKLKEIISIDQFSKISYQFEYDDKNKVSRINTLDNQKLVFYETLKTSSNKLVLEGYSQNTVVNGSSQFILTKSDSHELNSNGLVSQRNTSSSISYTSDGFIQSTKFESSGIKILDTYKIENENIVERFTESYSNGKLYLSVLSKYEYSKDLNENLISFLFYIDRVSWLFLDGYFGKFSKNKLIKITEETKDFQSSKNETKQRNVEYKFDSAKSEGTILFDSKPNATIILKCN